ncbi:septation protein SepH [Rarobacter incanus]|uniref:DUF3071 family protein n=1 Tax=Rarobacter incanus TaxID=153494 RepID=A0A542SLR3_9MICO|nr:septation protein SepH [Rarobacter incanus]TQK75563.1 DUF3071 family protein [Rarobacter incanus]
MSVNRGSGSSDASQTGTIIDLSLVGLHTDGEHLVLKAAGNTRFLLPINDELLAAVRGDRARLELLQNADTISPREIQGRVRAGDSADKISQESGIPIGHIHRYERPVLDERAFVARQARSATVGTQSDAPELGDLVTDRLASREVDIASIEWDAVKPPGGRWRVIARYMVGAEPTAATWTFDPRTMVLTAIDDEARWLSETAIIDEPIPRRRHLSSVRDEPFDVQAFPDGAAPAGADSVAPVYSLETGQIKAVVDTEALLDDLAARRGVRQPVEGPCDESAGDVSAGGSSAVVPLTGAIPVRATDGADAAGAADVADTHGSESDTVARGAGAAAAPTARATADADASPEAQPELELGDSVPPAEQARSAKGNRRQRSQMPTWDEIVFGAKTD